MLIEHPMLARLHDEPGRHLTFDDKGITDRIEDLRRPSFYFMPVPRPRKGTAGGAPRVITDPGRGWAQARLTEGPGRQRHAETASTPGAGTVV